MPIARADVGSPQRMRVLARIWESDRLKLSHIYLLDATMELLPGKVSCAVICPAAWREHRGQLKERVGPFTTFLIFDKRQVHAAETGLLFSSNSRETTFVFSYSERRSVVEFGPENVPPCIISSQSDKIDA